MTTIAYDGSSLVADRGATTGVFTNIQDKIVRIRIRRAHWSIKGMRPAEAFFAGSGQSMQIAHYRAWLEASDDGDPPSCGDSDFLIVTRRQAWRVDAAGFGVPLKRGMVAACGAGSEVAYGVMLAGKSAEHAVRLVMKHTRAAFGGLQIVERAWL